MLRIIGGKYRHLIIEAPDVITTRPTTDKVREGLMSALGFYLEDATVLDLFSGSGALGLEALSRGAKKAYFCDNNINAIKTIKKNIEKLKIDEEYEVIYGSYKATLEKLKGIKFDLVFLDPPYALDKVYDEVTNFLIDNNMLNEHATIVKEWNNEIKEDERFIYHRHYKYGIVHILIERN